VISFVIPVRDDARRLEACLERIVESSAYGAAVEIVVADNGSTDDSAAVGRRFGATVLDLPRLRVGELRNRAAAVAKGDTLAFVDADHEIGRGWIHAAVETLAKPGVGAVGSPCHPPSPPTWVQKFYDRLRRHPAAEERVDWLGSGNMAVRRSAFEEVGGFDVSLETCEDVDLCRKLRQRGYVLLADRRMENVHHGDPSTLRQVFFGELWRGRDNVRVSLRPPVSWRTLASALVPMANLTALGAIFVGSLIGSSGGDAVSVTAALFLGLLLVLRASVMSGRMWIGDWPKALAVAGAYEMGRALALVGRFGHRQRRGAATAS